MYLLRINENAASDDDDNDNNDNNSDNNINNDNYNNDDDDAIDVVDDDNDNNNDIGNRNKLHDYRDVFWQSSHCVQTREIQKSTKMINGTKTEFHIEQM